MMQKERKKANKKAGKKEKVKIKKLKKREYTESGGQ